MSEANKALIRRYLEEIDNLNWTVLRDEILAPNFIFHPSGQSVNLDEFEVLAEMYHTGFPDGRHTVDELVAEGDLVTCRHTFRGTHKGELQGVAPTGKEVTVTEIIIGRVSGGKLVEIWNEADILGLMQQIGTIPAAAQAAS